LATFDLKDREEDCICHEALTNPVCLIRSA
jgi:hypothetical protein